MSDYAERLRSRMSDGTESPYQAIGTVSGSVQPPVPVLSTTTSNRRQYLAAFTATMGNLVMGTCIAWSGPAVPLLKLAPHADGFNASDYDGSWIGSLMPLGALLGGQFGGVLVSRLGRKGAMMLDAGIFAVGYLFIISAPNLWMIYIGRFIGGIATGISSLACPVYVGEIAKPEIRGLLGSGVQVMVTIGVLLVIVIGAFLSWRWMSIVCLALVVLWALLLILIPESPEFYLSVKKYREARESLEWLRESIYVEAEYEDIQKNIEDSETGSAGIKDLFLSHNLPPLIISLYLMLGQQFSGMNAVIFNVVDIFNAAGSKISPNTESIIVAVVQVVATCISAAVMDRLGRRVLLNISAALMVVSISSLGAYFYILDYLHDTELAKTIQLLPVASLSTFVFGFSVGFGPIPWLMMSELFSPEVKSLASSIATTFNWSLAFVVTKFFTDLEASISVEGSFWVFGGITFVTFLFCLFFVPETKGKSMEQIQALFRSNRPYFLEIGVWKCCRRSTDSDLEVLVDEGHIDTDNVY